MTPEALHGGRITLWCGDCLDVLAALPDNSVDSCVCDPPYHLVSIVKRFANSPRSERTENTENPYGRTGRGFMGQKWDGGDIAFRPDVWREVLRVLKPGAHLVAFGGTRTFHRLACAVEDAGFEIRDCIMWVYGSGFPKSLNVSKAIDRAAGAEREVIGQRKKLESYGPNEVYGDGPDHGGIQTITAPATDAARQWDGFGTALKPAVEPIVLARKPLSEKTIAENMLRWGTGAINVDGCRVETDPTIDDARLGGNGQWHIKREPDGHTVSLPPATMGSSALGRWPANLCHDGSEGVEAAFPETQSGAIRAEVQRGSFGQNGIYGKSEGDGEGRAYESNSGSAARFFYTAKASNDDRLGSKHPTVKPVDLMQWLVRLVTPPGGTCIDPFAGTGTTGEAAAREGMRAVLIERELEYQDDIRRRMALLGSGRDERRRQTHKEKQKRKPDDAGPLFGGAK